MLLQQEKILHETRYRNKRGDIESLPRLLRFHTIIKQNRSHCITHVHQLAHVIQNATSYRFLTLQWLLSVRDDLVMHLGYYHHSLSETLRVKVNTFTGGR